jgi:cell fate regulator YaaT (PSP1 superfamily)
MGSDYEGLSEEDISSLEDKPEEELNAGLIVKTGETYLEPDTPVYRIRLSYSNETFLAVYRGEALKPGDKVMVPTRYGKDLAEIIGFAHCQCSEVALIERPVSPDDLARADRNKGQEEEAFKICKEKIEEHSLEMKLISAHYLLEEPKILFFFTAESRVDFRELVKDLVSIFRVRIELRQIGVRDESRVVGGMGVCGRGYCCNTVSDKLKPVSIKMAKDQNLSLNSMKISGPCGRLLCCLAYEHAFYNEQRRLVPSEGIRIVHEGMGWRVQEINAVTCKVSLTADDGRIQVLPFCSFARIDGRWNIHRPGAELDHP